LELPVTIRLNDRELATVLAALRYWQQDLADNENEGPIIPDHFDEEVTPLTVDEIEALCERLNVGEPRR
jgi:hypothetical protein